MYVLLMKTKLLHVFFLKMKFFLKNGEDACASSLVFVFPAYSKVTVIFTGAAPSSSTDRASGWLRPQYTS